MNWIGQLFRPRALIVGGFVVGSVSLLMVARIFAWNLMLVILILLAVLLIGIIVFLVRQLQQVKASEEIEKTIGSQADKEIERSVPGQQAALQNLKADLIAAIEALKKTRSGKKGESVLSTLPWYMLVGPSAAGKTEFMARSGLHFPLMDKATRRGRAVRGVGGTRAFEWWLSQEAVVLDMGGKTLTASAQFEDTDDWFEFLEVLKQQRPKKPLNGVIVAMPLDQLADRPDAQIDKLAGGIRERVQEVVNRLGVVFPVYVVFTKADLVAGFAEFFSDLQAAERGQPWGATIAAEAGRETPAEELFDEEFGHLIAAVGDRRLARIANVPDAYQRARTFAFPVQLDRLRAGMRRFVRGVFAPDPTQADSALFRGFYMTSSAQEGVPVDRVLEPAARSLGLAATAPPPPPQTSGAYFVHDLLTEVVFADADLAAASSSAVAARGRARLFMLGGLGLAFLATALLLMILAGSNAGLMRATRHHAQDVADRVHPESGLYDKLTTLDALRLNLVELEKNRRNTPWWRALGAYSGHPLIDPGVRLYSDHAIESLIRPAVEGLQAELNGRSAGDPGDIVDFYYKFRAWHLLRKPTEIVPDDKPLIVRAIQSVYASQLEAVPSDARPKVPGLIADQVEFLASHPVWMEKLIARYYPPDDLELVRRGQQALRAHWDAGAFYRDLMGRVSPKYKPTTLASLVPNLSVLSCPAAVQGAYTRDGWTKDVKPQIDWYRGTMNRDWVLRDAFGGTSPDLAADLTRAYSADYLSQWVQFLRAVAIEGPTDATDEMLKTVSKSDSPILKLLRAVGDQTMLGADPEAGLGQVRADFGLVHNFFSTSGGSTAGQVAAGIGKMFGQKGNRTDKNVAPSDLYLQEVQSAEKKYAEVAQPGTPPDQVKALLGGGDPASNPIKGAQSWVSNLADQYGTAGGTDATAHVLMLPLDRALGAVGQHVSAGLARKFEETVLTAFRPMSAKYPFSATGPDLAPYEFNEFFKSTGTFWTFYNAELKDLVKPDGTPINAGAASSAVTPEMRGFVRLASDIRDAFYSANPEAAGIKLSVRTSALQIARPAGINVRWVSFDVGGGTATYNMGPPTWQELAWPGPDATLGASLRMLLSSGTDAQSKNVPGPWGIFHLLDQAKVSQTAPNLVQATFTVPTTGGSVSVPYEIQTEAGKTPFSPNFFHY